MGRAACFILPPGASCSVFLVKSNSLPGSAGGRWICAIMAFISISSNNAFTGRPRWRPRPRAPRHGSGIWYFGDRDLGFGFRLFLGFGPRKSMAGGTGFNFTNAFVGDRGSAILDQSRAVPAFRGHERLAMLQAGTGNINQREWLGGFLAQRVEATLHRGHLVGMRGGDVVRFVGILGEVVEVYAGGNQRAPDEFPIALAHGAPERLDVIDDFCARRRFVLADGSP